MKPTLKIKCSNCNKEHPVHAGSRWVWCECGIGFKVVNWKVTGETREWDVETGRVKEEK